MKFSYDTNYTNKEGQHVWHLPDICGLTFEEAYIYTQGENGLSCSGHNHYVYTEAENKKIKEMKSDNEVITVATNNVTILDNNYDNSNESVIRENYAVTSSSNTDIIECTPNNDTNELSFLNGGIVPSNDIIEVDENSLTKDQIIKILTSDKYVSFGSGDNPRIKIFMTDKSFYNYVKEK